MGVELPAGGAALKVKQRWSAKKKAEVVKVGDRFAALEPIRQAVRERCGAFGTDVARGLKLRHDHGSQYMSDPRRDQVAGHRVLTGLCGRT